MFCSKCGKEISDGSIYCYSCGSKIDSVKSNNNLENVSIPPLDTGTFNTNNDTKEISPILEDTKTDLNPPVKIKHDISRGYGWVVLLSFYGYGISMYEKTNQFSGELYSFIIIFLGLLGIYPLYFWFRKYLIKKNFWKGHIGSSSCLSGIISYILVGSLVGGSIGLIGGYEKRKEITQFMKDFNEQVETLKIQEMGYTKILGTEHNTVSETNNKIATVDEYKKFLMKKNKTFTGLTNFFIETNSKYKNNKSVNEEIIKLELINGDVLKKSIYSMDMYKKYLMTDDDKYFNLSKEVYEKQPLIKDEITKLITNILKSL